MDKIVYKILIFSFLSILVFNVNAQKRKNPSEVNSSVVYVLPKTVLDVEVLAQKTILKRGPFADYADKYLGIKNGVVRDNEKWEIKKMEFSQHAEIDAQNSFELISNENYLPNMISLSKEGFIKGFNIKNDDNETKKINTIYNTLDKVSIDAYGSFSIDKILRFTKDTTFKIIETDTSFVRVPVLETKMSVKSIEDKAVEAAHQIFKLRKRRFKILTANYDILPPDGKSYEIIVRELEKLENQYMSLFVGKTHSQLKKFKFSYTPSPGQNKGVFFKFSRSKGPLLASNSMGEEVKIKFNINNVKSQAQKGNLEKSIFYRIPAQANFVIYMGDEIFLNENITISQFGSIGSYPVDILLNEEFSIEYHPDYGSIKRVYKIK